jgi:hypothetical protein
LNSTPDVSSLLATQSLIPAIFVGYKYTFFDPDLIQNGYIATYAIIATFLTANKANSIFNFLFGLSFERMVPIHNLASLVAVVLSFFRGYVAYVYGGGDSGDSSGGGNSRDRRLSSDSESQFALYGSSPQVWNFMWDGGINISGSLIILCLVGLVALSFFSVFRKYCFELWLDLEDDRRYPVVVCVSGGIGVTPCLSVARQLWHEHSKGYRKLSKLHFVWTVRDLGMVREIAPIEENSDPNGTFYSTNSQVYGNFESDDTEVPSLESKAGESGIKPVLISDVYVTQPFDKDLEGLDRALRVQKGRPDLEGILKSAKAEAIKCGASRVAVVGCGPLRLMEDLKALCSKHSSFALGCGGVHFDVHDEIFDF